MSGHVVVMRGSARAQRLQGAVFDLCRDQHGSRYVQTRLDSASKEEVGARPSLPIEVGATVGSVVSIGSTRLHSVC